MIHTCLLCNKPQTIYNINAHLKKEHNINLLEYAEIFRNKVSLFYIFRGEKYIFKRNELTCLKCGEKFKINFKKEYGFILNLNCKCSNKNNLMRLDCFFDKTDEINILISSIIKDINQTKNSLEKYQEKYGKEEGLEKFNDKNNMTSGSLNNFIRRYGEELGKLKYQDFCNKSARTLDNFINQYGEELGNKKWKNYKKNRRLTSKYCIEYWLKYTNDDKELANKLYSEFQDFGSKKYFIETYGEELGLEKFESVSKSKGVTEENYIKKYGYKNGLEKYEKYKNLQKGKGNLDFYISKYGKIKGTQKYLSVCKNRTVNNSPYSKISQELFWNLYKELPDDLKNNCYFAELNTEYFLINESFNYRFFDFVIPKIHLCIEYNGDIFHANPKIFKNDDHPNPHNKNATSEEIWEYDKNKYKLLLEKNIEYPVIIWDSDYRKNKKLEEEKLMEIINEKIKLYCR